MLLVSMLCACNCCSPVWLASAAGFFREPARVAACCQSACSVLAAVARLCCLHLLLDSFVNQHTFAACVWRAMSLSVRILKCRLQMMSSSLIAASACGILHAQSPMCFEQWGCMCFLRALAKLGLRWGCTSHSRAGLAWLGNVVDVFQAALVRLFHCRGVELSRSICDSGTATGAACASSGTKVVPSHKSILAKLSRFDWHSQTGF